MEESVDEISDEINSDLESEIETESEGKALRESNSKTDGQDECADGNVEGKTSLINDVLPNSQKRYLPN